MRLRKHQREMIEVIDGIIAGSAVNTIIVNACPGSGKSSLPLIAGKLITAGLADGLCWICPRSSLQDQGERNFIDPFFRKLLNHNLTIRSSTNEHNARRGTNGFITTYQAVGVDEKRTVLNEMSKRRYILVLDEWHHCEAEDGLWTKAILPLFEKAIYRVLMTGTASRGDGCKMAFIPYDSSGMPVLENNEHTAVIEYTRRDALAERAIIPLNFIFSDGVATWEKPSGKIVKSKISTETPQNANHALYTALRTEYAIELLSLALNHWQAHKANNPYAQLLVVSARIDHAKKYTKYLKEQLGLNAEIATSEDNKECVQAIKRFKTHKVDILVSVSVCYEGLDCPSISHIACLTNIRTAEWITQMVARAVRIDPHGGPYETQKGYIFAPDDLFFREITEKIEADQLTPAFAIKNGGNGKQKYSEENGDLFGESTPSGIRPLSSQIMGQRETILAASQFTELTISEQESDALNQIESHIRRYAFNNRINPKRINTEVFMYFGRKRAEMTLEDLRKCLEHVRARYPINYIRGTGRARVPTKAQPFPCEWR